MLVLASREPRANQPQIRSKFAVHLTDCAGSGSPAGAVFRLTREPQAFNKQEFKALQITAPISPGSSGGALLNLRGHVVGVTFLEAAGGQNLNFAVPINYVKPLLAAKTPTPLSAAGPGLSPSRTAYAILAAAVQAKGGAALDKIESLTETSSGEISWPGSQTNALEVETIIAYPDHIRTDLKLPFGTLRTGYDGKTAWAVSPQGSIDVHDLPSEIQRGIALVASGIGLYLQVRAGKIEAQYLGEEEIDGKKMKAVEWNAQSGPVKLYFDPTTHLLAAARFPIRQQTPQGSINVEQHRSDYSAVEGVQIAHQSVTYHDGAKFISVKVKDIRVNSKPDPLVFSKPQQ